MQVENPPAKSEVVKQMFASIAPRYDFLNHLLSLNIDRRWRRFTFRRLQPLLEKPGTRALDLCCGTADLSLELGRQTRVVGLDFCHPMLVIGQEKISAGQAPVSLAEGDVLSLPFSSGQFDAVTIAFGLRNLESIEGGLAEMYRMLKPGGLLAILEFSSPVVPVFSYLFALYFRHILPRIGALVSGVNGPYRYLHESVQTFPDQSQLAAMLRHVGFVNIKYHNLSGGIAALHLGERR